MDNNTILQEMLRYIDSHIKEKLNVEKLAKQAGFSPYYFCRMFQYGVGSSIMEYVRNRRLAYAASELGSGRKIINIAIDYGFETHSGFSKAFRRYFGCPPEIYRAYAAYNVPEIPDLSKINQFISNCVIEPKIMLKKPAFKLAGYTIKMKSREIETLNKSLEFWDECKTDGRLEKLHRESFPKYPVEYGAIYKNNKSGDFLCIIGVEAKSKTVIPFEYNVHTIPESLFAVFTTPPYNEDNYLTIIKDSWQFIFSEWLPNSGYEFYNIGTAFQLNDGRSMGNTGKVSDIYVPIVNSQL